MKKAKFTYDHDYQDTLADHQDAEAADNAWGILIHWIGDQPNNSTMVEELTDYERNKLAKGLGKK